MRLLPLDEEDTVLFNSQVNRTLYSVYRDNPDNFTLMWEQQGTGYWLKFCISLRSVLQKQGFSVQLSAFDLNHFEEFSINLAKLLTGKSAEAVHTYVKDVVSISRFHQLLKNIPNVSISKNMKLMPAFVRLFGSPLVRGNITKMFGVHVLHLRAVGCLLRLLEHWLDAGAVSTSDKSWWHPPESWHYGNQLQASHFEVFLKENWGRELLSLLSVDSKDICWWNALPRGNRITMFQERHCDLGRFIAAMCRDFDFPSSACFGIMKEDIFYHHIVASCPRGKFRIFSTFPATIMFVSALCHGLYLVDSLSAFHPFSQVVISFTNAAFSNEFWFGSNGMRTQLYLMEQRCTSADHPPIVMHSKHQVDFLIRVISGHLIRARIALALNSNFYDTLYTDVTWTSPVTLLRLPWNIPLLTNWLEVLLIKIYMFERFFVPLCHFPLNRTVIPLVESVYRKVSEAKFLVKTCLIIADGILKRQSKEASLCHEPRRMMCNTIPRLSHIMTFLERDAYTVLDVILKSGWNKEEREDGESCPLAADRVKVDLATWNSVPDINEYYSENFRHINYWISNAEWPDIGGGEEFFTEAVEILKDYKLGCKTPIEMKDPYKFSLFMECAVSGRLNFTDKRDDVTKHSYAFITLILSLLKEDGWLSPLAEEGFFSFFGEVYHVDHIQKRLNSNLSVEADEGVKRFEQTKNLCAVYYIAACLLGDTWQCKLAGQNAFALLQRSETHAIMADTGARLAVLMHVGLETVACPPAQYFQGAAAEIQKHSKDNQLGIEEAMLLLESFEKEADKKMDITTAEALTVVKVPLLEEMQMPSVGTNWLRYLENKRIQLLHLVSAEQLTVTRSYVKNNISSPVELFPLYDVLEHRLVEEMAAMQKCLELGGLYYGPAYGLCRLLAYRFAWIQQSFIKWKKDKHKFKDPLLPLGSSDMFLIAVNIRIRMLAALIPLQALFYTYISMYQTTHPINEMTIEMFSEWTDVARLGSVYDEWNSLGDCLREYSHALEQMGCRYIEQMLDHCNKVWVVAPFCSNPEDSMEFGSMKHAQRIVSTFTQLFLMCYYVILVKNPRLATMDITETVERSLVHVTMLLRQVEIDKAVTQAWPKARQVIKKEFRGLWSSLMEMRKAVVGGSAHGIQFPRWHGNSSSIWKVYFKTFVSSQYRNILHKIAFSEFISVKDPKSDDSSTIRGCNESEIEKNKSKAETTCVSPTPVPDKPGVISSGLSNSETKNAACKSNMTEMIVGDCDIPETKSQQNVHTKENHRQRQKHPNNDALNQNSQSGNEAPNKYKMCTYCKSEESERHTYKKCSLCKKESWLRPRFYCSKECQEKDWKVKHSMEHKSGEIL